MTALVIQYSTVSTRPRSGHPGASGRLPHLKAEHPIISLSRLRPSQALNSSLPSSSLALPPPPPGPHLYSSYLAGPRSRLRTGRQARLMAGSKSMGSPLSCIAQMLRKVGTGQLLLTSAVPLLAAVLVLFPLLPPSVACLSARRG